MPHRRFIVPLFVFVAVALYGEQAIDSFAAVPWADDSTTVWATGFSYHSADDASITRIDAWASGSSNDHFSLTAFETTPGFLDFSGCIIGLPPVDYGEGDLNGFYIPILKEGLRFGTPTCGGEAALVNGFIPVLNSVIDTQKVTLLSDPFWGASIDVHGFGIQASLLWLHERSTFRIDDETDIGTYHGSAGFASLGWKNIGLFGAIATGDFDLTVRTILSQWTGQFLSSRGNANLKIIGAWTRFGFTVGKVETSFLAGCAFVWDRDTEFDDSYQLSTAEGTKTERWLADWNPAGLALVQPAITWRPSGILEFTISRWIPLVRNRNHHRVINETSTGTTRPGGTSIQSLPWQTLVFSGLSVSIHLHIY
jgi:hypothetical protein